MKQGDTVIVLCYGEDGMSASRHSKVDFLRKLKEKYWGENCIFAPTETLPDPNYFTGLVVIDGDIVEPRPVQVVTEFEL